MEISGFNKTDASQTIFLEGQARNTVNNNAREVMGAVARAWFDSVEGDKDSTGSSNAYVVAANRTLSAYYDGMRIGFHANFANTGAATLDVDSVGAKTIKKNHDVDLASGDIEANQYVEVIYSATDDTWQLQSHVANAPAVIGAANLFTALQKFSKGADVASASPLVLGTDGNYFDVTGTTGFAAITVAAGALFVLQFDGALTITHGSGITLPGAANITTVAGDQALCYATAADTVTVLAYQRAAVSPVPMTQAQAEAGTDTTPRPVAAEQIAQAIAALAGSSLTIGTADSTLSGTTGATYGSLPAGIKRITVSFYALSLDDADNLLIQVGDSGGLHTTGYTASGRRDGAGNVTSTAGFIISIADAAATITGNMVLTNIDGNVWHSAHYALQDGASNHAIGSGYVTLDSALTQLALLDTGGDNFDGGTVNIAYEV